MKKLLCILLVLFLLPMTFMFSACKKEDSYKLVTLKSDLLSIADKYQTVVIEDDNLRFGYAELTKQDDTIIEDCINNVLNYYSDCI